MILLRWMLVLALVLGFSACTEKTKSVEDASLVWEEIIEKPSTDAVDPTGLISVVFVGETALKPGVTAQSLIDISPEPSYYSVYYTPSYSGKTLINVAGTFEHSKTYEFTLHTDKLEHIPEKYKTYHFSHTMEPLDYTTSVDGFEDEDLASKMVSFNGEVRFNSVYTLEDMPSILAVSLGGKAVDVTWSADNAMRLFRFKVSNLYKKEALQELSLSWFDPKTHQPRNIETFAIPRVQDFNVNRVYVSGEEQVKVIFSQVLSAQNSYKDLVQLEGLGIASIVADGKTLTITPSRRSYGVNKLTIFKAVKSLNGELLKKAYTHEVIFQKRKPAVRFTGKGVILPHAKHLEVPIEVTNVKSVHLRAFKVYQNNIAQFLQENRLDGDKKLKNVGRFLWDKKIELDDVTPNARQNLSLDVTKLLETEDGAMIRLTLYIDRSDSLYRCSEAENAIAVKSMRTMSDLDEADFSESGGWDAYESSYERQRKSDPCNDYYYEKNSYAKSEKNLLRSNIGIIAKTDADSENVYVALTTLEDAKVLNGAKVRVYNFQNQRIGSGVTDRDGLVKIKVNGIPFYLKAKHGRDVGYVKMTKGLALSVSQFDVSGVRIKQKLNGYIYGERDVWRPGDKIFLTFVLDDVSKKLPKNYPVTMELFGPDGQVMMRKVNVQPTDGMYAFEMQTEAQARTGKWKVVASVGNLKFSKDLAIETVVPNRLKVELNIDADVITSEKVLNATLFAQWLHGAKASHLKSDVSVRTHAIVTNLGRYNTYVFDDITRSYASGSQELFSGTLDEEGRASFKLDMQVGGTPSGMLRASFTSKVYEEGGGFSANTQSFVYHPYSEYVGLKLPKGDATRGMILTDKDHDVKLAVLDPKGRPVANSQLTVSLYKISWRWWWDKAQDNLAKYSGSNSHDLVSSGSVTSDANGQATWKLRVNYPQWGRYLVRACDEKSQHCSSKIVYIDWPGWAGRAVEENSGGVARLTLASDKKSYKVGETAVITLPKSKNSRLLVSLENGEDVIKQYWVKSGEEHLKIKITKAMAPNIYVCVSLVQPHADRENDKAIRLMGIVNLMVDNPKTHLHPELNVPKEVKPAQSFKVEVQERDGRAMAYSLAIVDEGLLGLTNYKTPSLHRYFYKRKGLQVKTWDIYDDVVGAYSGELERMLDVGGSDSAKEEERNKKRRFPPVVKYLGTFSLAKGEVATHHVKLPQYIGAVRVMVVAAKEGNYGKADQSVLVRSPLSILANLPRALNTQEDISLPVELFVMQEGIKDVEVSVEAESDFFEVVESKKRLSFNGMGEQIAQLKLKTKNKVGKAKITIRAKSAKKSTKKVIYIDITAPNPSTITSQSKKLSGGEAWKFNFSGHGIEGSNQSTLELSTRPLMNLESRQHRLTHYPHGCVEQTTSSVFAQLYLPELMTLNPLQKEVLSRNINAAIKRLASFQVSGGGLSYWPGEQEVHLWGTNYAMHFLLEAKRKGYTVPATLLEPLLKFQMREAKKLIASDNATLKTQAYRLYLLSLAHKIDMSAMYRLKEEPRLDNVSRWILAATYYSAGQKDVAKTLTQNTKIAKVEDVANNITFASDLREKAMMLLAASTLKKDAYVQKLSEQIAKRLRSKDHLNTQSMGFALMAMSRLRQPSQSVEMQVSVDGVKQMIRFEKSTDIVTLPALSRSGSKIEVKNLSTGSVNVLLNNRGIPAQGDEKNASNSLQVSTFYVNAQGAEVDPKLLKQGTNFEVEVSVYNKTSEAISNVALTYRAASGWQVLNERLEGGKISSDVDYQDIRDNTVYTYLSIPAQTTASIHLQLNASYRGAFYLPAVHAESMYDSSINATQKGQKVVVTK